MRWLVFIFLLFAADFSLAQEGGAGGAAVEICSGGHPLYSHPQPEFNPFVCPSPWTASRHSSANCPLSAQTLYFSNGCSAKAPEIIGVTLSCSDAPDVPGWSRFSCDGFPGGGALALYEPESAYSINITGELSLTLSTDGDGEILFSLDADTGVTVIVDGGGGGGGSVNPTALLSAEYLGSVWVPDAVVATIGRDLGSVYSVPTTLVAGLYSTLGNLSARIYTVGPATRSLMANQRKYYAHRYVESQQELLSSLVVFPQSVTSVSDMVNHFSNLPGFFADPGAVLDPFDPGRFPRVPRYGLGWEGVVRVATNPGVGILLPLLGVTLEVCPRYAAVNVDTVLTVRAPLNVGKFVRVPLSLQMRTDAMCAAIEPNDLLIRTIMMFIFSLFLFHRMLGFQAPVSMLGVGGRGGG